MSTSKTLGVVIGRFQTDQLHAGHLHLINFAMKENNDLLVLIGSGAGLPSSRNPLSFKLRKQMILSEFGDAHVLELHNHPSDEVWSQHLDKLLLTVFPNHEVTLYGSRDSFISHYSGANKTQVVSPIESISGTERRILSLSNTSTSPDFRRGVIHAAAVRPTIPYPAVDIAIVRHDRMEVLLGQKKIDGEKRRLIGGFFDPQKDLSFEMAAKREAFEETSGMEIGDFVYLGSSKIDDWRYRGETDMVVSSFFKATYCFGAAVPSDDLDALYWTPYEEVLDHLIPSHRHFGELLLKSLTQ